MTDRMRGFALALLMSLAMVGGASAQNIFPTPAGTSSSVASGDVQMCLNALGQAVPVSSGTCAAPAQVSQADAASVTASVSSLATWSNMPIDTTGYGQVTFQFTAVGNSGNRFTPQVSNDGSTWTTAYVEFVGQANTHTPGAYIGMAPVVGEMWRVRADARWFRLVEATWVSGTDTAAISLRATASPLTVQQGLPNASTPWPVSLALINSNGGQLSITRLVSAAASTNATSVKNSAGRLYKCDGYNAAASARFLKFYNKASAPTVGTDTPFYTLALQPSAKFDLNWADMGLNFSTGIAFALTVNAADSDTTAVTAADVVGLNCSYF